MKTHLKSVFLVLVCTFLGAVAQVLFKFGSNKLLHDGIQGIITNYWIYSGYFCYFLSSILLIIALKNGELSVLYPIIAMTYIWVSLLSPMFFQTDDFSILKFIGLFFIFFGVTSIGVGSKI